MLDISMASNEPSTEVLGDIGNEWQHIGFHVFNLIFIYQSLWEYVINNNRIQDMNAFDGRNVNIAFGT